MKEVINPAYGRFEDFVRRVPRIFSEEGKTIYKARNEIKVFEVDGVELNDKRQSFHRILAEIRDYYAFQNVIQRIVLLRLYHRKCL